MADFEPFYTEYDQEIALGSNFGTAYTNNRRLPTRKLDEYM